MKQHPNTKKHKIARQGQLTVEMLLIMVVLVSLIYLAREHLMERNNMFVAFITTPWKYIDGMIESGVWGENTSVRNNHPSHWKRMYTKKGKPLQ